MSFSLVEVTPGVAGAFQAIEAVHELFESDTSFAIVAKGMDTSELRLHEPSSSDEPAILLMTSGSTGNPRGIEIPLSALAHSAESAAIYMQRMSVWLTALPVTSMGGLNTIIRSALTGIEPVIWDGVGGATKFDAENFLPFLKAVKTASLKANLASAVSLVPTQLFRLAQDKLAMTELAELDFVLVGGGPVSSALKNACENSGINLISTYGATETVGGCVFNGESLAGYQVDVLDGLVEIKSEFLAWGYRDGKPLNGVWKSKDRGKINNGKLEILGRIDSVIKVSGVLVDLQDLEAQIQAKYPGMEIYVSSKPDAEYGAVPYVFSTSDLDDFSQTINQIIKHPLPIRFHKINEIPMLLNGKPDRMKLSKI